MGLIYVSFEDPRRTCVALEVAFPWVSHPIVNNSCAQFLALAICWDARVVLFVVVLMALHSFRFLLHLGWSGGELFVIVESFAARLQV